MSKTNIALVAAVAGCIAVGQAGCGGSSAVELGGAQGGNASSTTGTGGSGGSDVTGSGGSFETGGSSSGTGGAGGTSNGAGGTSNGTGGTSSGVAARAVERAARAVEPEEARASTQAWEEAPARAGHQVPTAEIGARSSPPRTRPRSSKPNAAIRGQTPCSVSPWRRRRCLVPGATRECRMRRSSPRFACNGLPLLARPGSARPSPAFCREHRRASPPTAVVGCAVASGWSYSRRTRARQGMPRTRKLGVELAGDETRRVHRLRVPRAKTGPSLVATRRCGTGNRWSRPYPTKAGALGSQSGRRRARQRGRANHPRWAPEHRPRRRRSARRPPKTRSLRRRVVDDHAGAVFGDADRRVRADAVFPDELVRGIEENRDVDGGVHAQTEVSLGLGERVVRRAAPAWRGSRPLRTKGAAACRPRRPDLGAGRGLVAGESHRPNLHPILLGRSLR